MAASDKHTVPFKTDPSYLSSEHVYKLKGLFKVHWIAFLLQSYLEVNGNSLQASQYKVSLSFTLWHIDILSAACPIHFFCILPPFLSVSICKNICVIYLLIMRVTYQIFSIMFLLLLMWLNFVGKWAAYWTVGRVRASSRSYKWESSKLGDLLICGERSTLSPIPKALSLPSWRNFAKSLLIFEDRVKIMSDGFSNNCAREREVVLMAWYSASSLHSMQHCSAVWEQRLHLDFDYYSPQPSTGQSTEQCPNLAEYYFWGIQGPKRVENVFETGILPDPIGDHHKISCLSPAGLVYLLAFPQYLSDRMHLVLKCFLQIDLLITLTPLARFGLLNCPAVWLSTLGLRITSDSLQDLMSDIRLWS